MSRNQNNGSWGGSIAGVAVGIGALAAIGYGLYEVYQQQQAETQQATNNQRRQPNSGRTSNNPTPDSQESARERTSRRTSAENAASGNPSNRRRAVKQTSRRSPAENSATSTSSENGRGQELCPVCGNPLSAESIFGLPCNHTFHKHCIQANFVLHHHEEEFRCPINNCKKIVPETVITRMFA